MAVYLVAYDIPADNPSARETLQEELEKGPWAQISESVYVVQREESAQEVFDNLYSKMAKPINNIYVFEVTDNFAGTGAGASVEKWLLNMKVHFSNLI